MPGRDFRMIVSIGHDAKPVTVHVDMAQQQRQHRAADASETDDQQASFKADVEVFWPVHGDKCVEKPRMVSTGGASPTYTAQSPGKAGGHRRRFSGDCTVRLRKASMSKAAPRLQENPWTHLPAQPLQSRAFADGACRPSAGRDQPCDAAPDGRLTPTAP
jgi:hypothetical protein